MATMAATAIFHPHSYNTILRSHVGLILDVVARGPSCDEFASLGSDKSIRLWDVISGSEVLPPIAVIASNLLHDIIRKESEWIADRNYHAIS